jgi:hypothetical protein
MRPGADDRFALGDSRWTRMRHGRALQIDPNDVDALDGTAVTYFFDFINGWGDPGTDYNARRSYPNRTKHSLAVQRGCPHCASFRGARDGHWTSVASRERSCIVVKKVGAFELIVDVYHLLNARVIFVSIPRTNLMRGDFDVRVGHSVCGAIYVLGGHRINRLD